MILPALISMVFLFLVFNSAGYLMQAIADEKTNRTMEVLVTSVSTNQLTIGKTLGIIGVSFTLFLAWILFAVLGISGPSHLKRTSLEDRG